MNQINALVVDDNETDRYIARRVLTRSNVVRSIEERTDGSEALELIKDPVEFQKRCGPCPPPALFLLDINMPRMSGFELLQSIQELGNSGAFDTRKSCIVMMLTSSNYDGDRERALEFDFVAGYIEKPFSRDKLQALVERHYPGVTLA